MDNTYDVLLAQKAIGEAKVIKQGLYYRFRCRCRLSGEVLYKIIVHCGDRQESLGVCVPKDGQFGLETHIPIKRLGTGEMTFRAVPKHVPLEGKFVPVRAQEPFAYIEELYSARFCIQNGEKGVLIKQE